MKVFHYLLEYLYICTYRFVCCPLIHTSRYLYSHCDATSTNAHMASFLHTHTHTETHTRTHRITIWKQCVHYFYRIIEQSFFSLFWDSYKEELSFQNFSFLLPFAWKVGFHEKYLLSMKKQRLLFIMDCTQPLVCKKKNYLFTEWYVYNCLHIFVFNLFSFFPLLELCLVIIRRPPLIHLHLSFLLHWNSQIIVFGFSYHRHSRFCNGHLLWSVRFSFVVLTRANFWVLLSLFGTYLSMHTNWNTHTHTHTIPLSTDLLDVLFVYYRHFPLYSILRNIFLKFKLKARSFLLFKDPRLFLAKLSVSYFICLLAIWRHRDGRLSYGMSATQTSIFIWLFIFPFQFCFW